MLGLEWSTHKHILGNFQKLQPVRLLFTRNYVLLNLGSILKCSPYQEISLSNSYSTSKISVRGLKPLHSGAEMVSLECSNEGNAAAAAARESWLTYLACLFSSSRFRLATYPSRYFWSSSNVPTVWLNVLSKIKWNVLLWQYQDNLTLCSRVPVFLRLHGGISMCVLARPWVLLIRSSQSTFS